MQSIRIGLFLNDKINSDVVGTSSDGIFRSVSGSGAKELIRGEFLNGEKLGNILTTMVFRFCISSKSFYYFDADCKNINKVESKFLDEKEKYRFGITFCTPGSDYKVSFVNVRVMKDLSTVDKFWKMNIMN